MRIHSLLEQSNKTFFKPGGVYYQVIDGEKYYFRAIKKSKSGRWQGKLVEPRRPTKALNKSVPDSSTNFNYWHEASNEEVPEILAEE